MLQGRCAAETIQTCGRSARSKYCKRRYVRIVKRKIGQGMVNFQMQDEDENHDVSEEMIHFQMQNERQNGDIPSKIVHFQMQNEPQGRAFSSEMVDFQIRK